MLLWKYVNFAYYTLGDNVLSGIYLDKVDIFHSFVSLLWRQAAFRVKDY